MTDKAKMWARLEEKANIERTCLHQGKIITLVKEKVQYEDGQDKIFDVILHPGAVAMIPIDQEGNLILVKQWRRAAKQILLELPAGTLEVNEQPAQCAQRELQEEIGYRANQLIPLGGFFTAPGFCNEYIYLYLAKDLNHSALIGDDSDQIDLEILPLQKALDFINEGKIIDAKTIAGIYRYQMNR